MKSTASSSLLCLAALTALGSCATANIPDGLSVLGNPELTLDARFPLSSWPCGSNPYVTFKPGQKLQSTDTKNAPTFNPNSAPFAASSLKNSTGKYVFLMVDPNTNTTDPTAPALHTIYANVTSSNGGLNWTVLAPFVNPMPNSVAPHNYTLLLFEQPEAQFVVPAEYLSYLPLNFSDPLARENFPIVDFVRDAGLGVPVAGNWFREGLSSSSSSATPSARVCSVTTPTPSASGTGVVWNSTATRTTTGTGTGILPSSTGTSTGTSTSATSTSPALGGKAAVYSASLENVLFGLGAVVVGAWALF